MMKSLIILTLLIFSSNAFSYTLNNNFGAAFKSNNVKVRIAGNSQCDGVTPEYLEELIGPATKDFWNRVPTSALRLKSGGFTEQINNLELGYLCPPTDKECIDQGSTIPPVTGIVIGCNDNMENFSNATSVLAVTVPNNFSKDAISGAVILINNQSAFKSLSRNEQISVIAHEIGHAIGLGHSKDDAALMYYRTIDFREKLGKDDIDGVSYLYPVKTDACGLLATIDETKTPPFFTTIGALLLMMLMSECLRLFKRAK